MGTPGGGKEKDIMKLPALQFYTSDWLSDPGVRSVSFAARGFWMDLLCLMSENDHRGYLELNGKPIPVERIARMTGGRIEEVELLIIELEEAGVFSRKEGVIYSRRIDRDEHIRQVRSEAGKLGAPFGKDGGRPKKTANNGKKRAMVTANITANFQDKGLFEKGQNNPPSSSSSFSSPITDIKDIKTSSSGDDGYSESFLLFWSIYPSKIGKMAAYKSWKKLKNTTAKTRDIIEAVKVQISTGHFKPDFIPNPATWLNQHRWEDETPTPSIPEDDSEFHRID